MQKTMLFVHGINVRGEAYYSSLSLIAQKARHFLPGIRVAGCQWGDPFGARLNKEGVSVPQYDETGDAQPAVDDSARALWFLLSQDPLLELRVLPRDKVIGEKPGAWIWQQFPAIASNAQILQLLSDCGIADKVWVAFVTAIVSDENWTNTVTAITENRAAASIKVARAATAAFQIDLLEKGFPGLSGAQRDLLRDALVQPFGGPPLGITDWFLNRLTNVGAYLARRRRGRVTDLSSPAVGDVLLYQARGEQIRNFIGVKVEQHSANIILAHSLGGVAVVDWLATSRRPVDYLITIGSQAPYFYELNALVSRSFGEGLPEFFPRKWLNFYDRSDLLSFKGEGIFPGRITDCEVASGQPFPEAHSAYLQNDDQVWRKIAGFLSED